MGDTDALDLALRLMSGGTPQCKMEQTWAAKLLYAGLQDGGDADLYRRKFIIELLCAAFDGPSVSGLESDLGRLLLGTVARAAHTPGLNKHLILNTGVVGRGQSQI